MTTHEPPSSGDDPTASSNHPPSYGSTPPPGGYSPPGGYPPPGGYQPPTGGYPPPGAPGGYGAPLDSNKKALWSMIAGIVSLFCCGVILGPVAIALSTQAKNEIAATGGVQPGSGQAKAGLILGIVGIVGWVIFLVLRFAVLES